MTLTLVPESSARIGARFRFLGANAGEECQGCPFQKLCFGLTPSRNYQVKALRPVSHPCGLHEGSKAHVVEVEEVGFTSSLETRHLRGTAATWSPIACGRPDCASYGLCHPVGAQAGVRHAIEANHGPLACPAGFDLVQVTLRPME
ncbi:MAG: UPF0179 family protein [Candidatus Thermoplasmatota archaeon]